jgi:hypothetical protein
MRILGKITIEKFWEERNKKRGKALPITSLGIL